MPLVHQPGRPQGSRLRCHFLKVQARDQRFERRVIQQPGGNQLLTGVNQVLACRQLAGRAGKSLEKIGGHLLQRRRLFANLQQEHILPRKRKAFRHFDRDQVGKFTDSGLVLQPTHQRTTAVNHPFDIPGPLVLLGFLTLYFVQNAIEQFVLSRFRRDSQLTTFASDRGRRQNRELGGAGAVDVEQLLRDLEALNRSDSEWFEASLPFPGTWLGPPRHPNLLALVRTLRERGFLADAAEYVQRFDAVLRGDPEYAELLADMAADFRDADQLDKAQFFLERAIGVNANLARAHQMLVDLLLPQGSDSGVRASLEKLVCIRRSCRRACCWGPITPTAAVGAMRLSSFVGR